jgi:hypothetical protein
MAGGARFYSFLRRDSGGQKPMEDPPGFHRVAQRYNKRKNSRIHTECVILIGRILFKNGIVGGYLSRWKRIISRFYIISLLQFV